MVADVLTFYQERIANEGYLRTATERRSVLELARLVGYSPRPGVAASTYLAYTLEAKIKPAAANGAATVAAATLEEPETLIPAGAAAKSVPGPGEAPQTFETSDDLVARAAWNNLQVRLTRPQQLEQVTEADRWPVLLYFKGIATNLKPNDPLLIETDEGPKLYRVVKVDPDAPNDRTKVAIRLWLEPELMLQRVIPEAAPRPTFTAALQETLQRATEQKTLLRSALARQILACLKPLRTALEARAGEPQLRAAVEKALPKLREAHAEAEARKAHRLEPWIGGLLADLQSAAASSKMEAADAPGAGTVSRMIATTDDDSAPTKTTTLASVIGALGKATKPQLASAHFHRDPQKLFGLESDLAAQLLTVARPELHAILYQAWASLPATPLPRLKVCALRARASVFGHQAPKRLVPDPDQQHPFAFVPQEWALEKEAKTVVWLDTTYPQILPGSWIALLRPAKSDGIEKLVITRVVTTEELSRAQYGLSARVTRLELRAPWLDLRIATEPPESDERDTFAVIRGTAVYAQCEELELAEEPITKPLCGGEIELAQLYDGLQPGRWLIVTGERTDVEGSEIETQPTEPAAIQSSSPEKVQVTGVPAAELVMLAGVQQGLMKDPKANAERAPLAGERIHTTLSLATELAYCYRRESVQIYGNVAPRHARARPASRCWAAATPPRPYQSSRSSSRRSPTSRRPRLRASRARCKCASTTSCGTRPTARPGSGRPTAATSSRTDDDGQTTVVFGDGERGARLPTGPENVRAKYRNGIGKEGNVKAGQISQLATRPLGVKDVINPHCGDRRRRRREPRPGAAQRAAGGDGAGPAGLHAGLRRLRPHFRRHRQGQRGASHRRPRASSSTSPSPARTTSRSARTPTCSSILKAALRRFGDPRQPLQLALRERSFLVIQAEVRVLPDYLWEKVEPKIRGAMLEAFGFARRDLGPGCVLSEVYRTHPARRRRGLRGRRLVCAARSPRSLEQVLDFE